MDELKLKFNNKKTLITGLIIAIFALYYNWLYAKTHGFIAWLLFGEIIASLKALVWPLFEFNII